MIDYDLRNSGFINYDALNNIERELREQYAVQETQGVRYKRPEDLGTIFRTQAAKLAAQGVESIYDLVPSSYEFQGDDRGTVTNLLNKRTGDVLREARLQEGWEEDPTAVTFKKTRNLEGETVNQPIELQSRAEGFDRWGYDTSVEGMAHYGINFVDGVPVFTPYYKDTASKIFGVKIEDAVKAAAAIAAAYYGGSALLSSGAGTAGAGAAAGTAGTAGAGAATGTAIVGTPGVSTIYTVAAPSIGVSTLAPQAIGATGSLLAADAALASGGAPISTATAIPAGQLAYPAVEVASIPNASLAPTSFQAALPGLGVETAASAAPFTAAPGSFQAAVPSLLAPAASGSSLLSNVRDVARLGDLANTIFNPPKLGSGQQQPIRRPQSQFSLSAPQPTVVGLLPLAERYRRSLI
jgi:hypothetical protein